MSNTELIYKLTKEIEVLNLRMKALELTVEILKKKMIDKRQ